MKGWMGSPKMIDVSGINTRYFEAGTGMPLVLIHGGQYGVFDSAYSWSLNFKMLSKHFHVVAFDRLGMGYTDNPRCDADYTMDATIEHAYRFIRALSLKRIAVAGHSRGGFVAARLALDHPDLVRKLLVVSSVTLAPDDPSVPKLFYAKLDKRVPRVPTRRSVGYEPASNSYSKDHVTEDFIDESYRVANLPKMLEARGKMKIIGQTFIRNLNKRKRETLWQLREGALRQPTLLLWGFNDPSAPFQVGIRLFKLISMKNRNVQFHLFNGAGHYVFRERPKGFAKVVVSFLSGDV